MFDGNKFTSILNVAPQLRDRTLLVNGVSKVFAMTGWRVGYSAGPKHLLDGINTIQGQSTTPACSVSQAASLAALTGPKDFIMHRAQRVFKIDATRLFLLLRKQKIFRSSGRKGHFTYTQNARASSAGEHPKDDAFPATWISVHGYLKLTTCRPCRESHSVYPRIFEFRAPLRKLICKSPANA